MTGKIGRRAGVLLALLAFGLGPAWAQEKPPLRIGVLLPFTGNAAGLGAATSAGVKLAVREINAAGGIAGRHVELVYGDDQNDTTHAVFEARRLIQEEKIAALVGANNSQVGLAVAPILAAANIAAIAYMGSNALTPASAPTMFSTLGSSDVQTESMIKYAAETLHATRIAILDDDSASSKGFETTVDVYAKKYGVAVIARQQFGMNSTDMVPQLLALRRADPQALLVSNVVAADLGHVLMGVQEIGWNVRLVGNPAMTAFVPIVLKMAGPQVLRNAVGDQLKALTYCSNDPVGSSKQAKFLARLEAFDPAAFAAGNHANAMAMYDGMYILKAAIEATGGTDGARLAQWIETQSGSLTNLLTGVPEPSPQSRFLFGLDAAALADDLSEVRADGLQKRAGC